MTTLQSEFWTVCNLLNSKSVSDTNRELQQSSLLLIKAFTRRTDVLMLRRGRILSRSLTNTLVDFMNHDTWSERVKLESNTTPRFLILCASEI